MLTTGDVAKLFDVSAQTVINWLEQGRLPCERIGKGPRRLSEQVVLRYIKEVGISPESLEPNIYGEILRRTGQTGFVTVFEAAALVRVDGLLGTCTDKVRRLLGLGSGDVAGIQFVRMARWSYLPSGEEISSFETLSRDTETELRFLRTNPPLVQGRALVSPYGERPGVFGGWVFSLWGTESMDGTN